MRRTLDFVELLQAQAPLITAAGGAYFGVRRRLEAVRRRVIRLGLAALVVGAGLYVLLARPDTARAVLPAQVPTDWVHAGLLALLLALIAALVLQGRDLSRGE